MAEIAETYGGTLYAIGQVAAPPKPVLPDAGGYNPYWRSRVTALVGEVTALDRPLLLREHAGVLPQPTKGITELTAKQFEALVEILGDDSSRLRKWLKRAKPARLPSELRETLSWREAASRLGVTFRHETELRGAIVDDLLKDIADPGTSPRHEVRCVRAEEQGKRETGRHRADALLRLGGRWLPVEVKLTFWTWPDVLEQVANYVDALAFHCVGENGEKERIYPSNNERWAGTCLLADRDGLYVVRDRGFVHCSVGAPLITRSQLATMPAAQIRSTLLGVIRSGRSQREGTPTIKKRSAERPATHSPRRR